MIVSRDAQVSFFLVCNFCTLGCRVLGRPLFNYQLIMVKALLPWFSNFPSINLRIQTTSCPNSFDISQHPLMSGDLRSVCLKYACYSSVFSRSSSEKNIGWHCTKAYTPHTPISYCSPLFVTDTPSKFLMLQHWILCPKFSCASLPYSYGKLGSQACQTFPPQKYLMKLLCVTTLLFLTFWWNMTLQDPH